MTRSGSRIVWLAGAVAAVAASAGAAYHIGYDRGAEAGLWTGGDTHQIACATGALITMTHLRAGEHDEALAILDSTIDAGIASNWSRIQSPSFYADTVPPATELVEYLVEYRRANPSTAAAETPNLNRSVSQYLAYLDSSNGSN